MMGGNGSDTDEMNIEELIGMIEKKMQGGVSRLSVGFSDTLDANTKVESYHHGRCDVGSPWAKGTVSNCDAIDQESE